jgi:thiamine biosynthesis lipoprotein
LFKILSFFFILIFGSSIILGQDTLSSYQETFEGMGTQIELNFLAKNKDLAQIAVQTAKAEFKRIENLISSWSPTSQTTKINQNAGIQPIKVDLELFQLIEKSKKISKLTKGTFDISFASINNIWKFDGAKIDLPSQKTIRKSVAKINYKNIILNNKDTTVFLKKKGMKIGFGAIGKGYVGDKIQQLLQRIGIKSGLINAGGDITVWGNELKPQGWKIGLFDPSNEDALLGMVKLKDQAIVTSGDAYQFVLINDKRYTHIINPKTGWPSRGLKTVTVIAQKAEMADALATAIFVLGEKKGKRLINKLKDVEVFMVNEMGEFIMSNGFPFIPNSDIQKN